MKIIFCKGHFATLPLCLSEGGQDITAPVPDDIQRKMMMENLKTAKFVYFGRKTVTKTAKFVCFGIPDNAYLECVSCHQAESQGEVFLAGRQSCDRTGTTVIVG